MHEPTGVAPCVSAATRERRSSASTRSTRSGYSSISATSSRRNKRVAGARPGPHQARNARIHAATSSAGSVSVPTAPVTLRATWPVDSSTRVISRSCLPANRW